jgi:hypothetical protein
VLRVAIQLSGFEALRMVGGRKRRVGRGVDVRMRAPSAGSLRESSGLGRGPCAKSWRWRKSPRALSSLHELVRPVIWGENGQDGADCCCKDQLQKRYQFMKLNICTIAGSAGPIDRNSPPAPRDQQGLHRSKRADPPGDTHHWTPRRLVCHNRHPQSHGTHPNPRPRPRRMGPPLDP